MVVDVKELLEKYGVKGLSQRGEEVSFCCPFHNDKNPSASMNTKSLIFHCFTCHAKGTVIDFISRIENIPFEEAKVLSITKGFTRTEIDLIQKVRDMLFGDKDKGEKEIDEKVLEEYNKQIHTSVLKRVQDKEVLKLFEVGYSKKDRRTTMPVRNHMGKLIAIIGRSVGDAVPRYKNIVPIKGFKKSSYLYGLHLCKQEPMIIVCEGEFDVINFYKCKFPYAVAIMGSSMSDRQLDLLTRYTSHVVLALDNDNAGKEATEKIANKLRKVVKVNLFQYPGDKKDPGELTQKELYNGLGNSIEYTDKLVKSSKH